MKNCTKSTIILVVILFLTCCFRKTKIDVVEDTINNYQDYNFNFFRNTFIHIRSSNLVVTRVFLGKYTGNLSPYCIHYNTLKKEVEKIDNSMLTNFNESDYFTEQEIKSLIDSFMKLEIPLLGVDEQNNVFLNPCEINSPPMLLRTYEYYDQDSLFYNRPYIRYSKKWYINRSEF